MLYTTDENEEKLIRDSIFLPILRKVIERDMRTLSRTKLPQPYLILAKNMLKKISNDLCIIKKSMASRGLKVYESAQDVNEVSYDVIIRGYEEKIKFKRVIMKRISEEYLVHYMHINHRRATD